MKRQQKVKTNEYYMFLFSVGYEFSLNLLVVFNFAVILNTLRKCNEDGYVWMALEFIIITCKTFVKTCLFIYSAKYLCYRWR